jgi:hypothetical protein
MGSWIQARESWYYPKIVFVRLLLVTRISGVKCRDSLNGPCLVILEETRLEGRSLYEEFGLTYKFVSQTEAQLF